MKFVIWEHSFDDTIGGNIALHLLCRRLGEIGEEAMMWPAGRPSIQGRPSVRELLRSIRWAIRGVGGLDYDSGPFGNRVARQKDLPGSIVVYPEIVSADPLRVGRVVRWLLHKPGHHTGAVDYGPADLFFHYQDGFQDPSYPSQRLTLSWRNEVYRDLGQTDRCGSAYLVRKGKGRPIVHDLSNSICVDDVSHEERAAIFNRVEYVYSYDLYTMYSRYAAICGAVPVIIPEPDLPRDQWVPREEERYGLAYGVEEVPWAINTRDLLLQRLEEERREEDRMLREFVGSCRHRFA